MLVYKNIIVEDWAIEQVAEAMVKIYDTPERKKILQNFELELSKFIKLDSDKEMDKINKTIYDYIQSMEGCKE